MDLTRLGHACIRIVTSDGFTVVVDPGAYSDPTALVGAQAVFITHEHGDHFQRDVLLEALVANPALRVWTNRSVADLLEAPAGRVTVVGNGDAVTVGGLDVRVYGEWHAPVHADIPIVANVGFLLGGSVFHPGDAFTVPGVRVDTLLLPVHAPWSKAGEVVDYIREVAPVRAYPVHDALLSDLGRGSIANLLRMTSTPYEAVAPDGNLPLGPA